MIGGALCVAVPYPSFFSRMRVPSRRAGAFGRRALAKRFDTHRGIVGGQGDGGVSRARQRRHRVSGGMRGAQNVIAIAVGASYGFGFGGNAASRKATGVGAAVQGDGQRKVTGAGVAVQGDGCRGGAVGR